MSVNGGAIGVERKVEIMRAEVFCRFIWGLRWRLAPGVNEGFRWVVPKPRKRTDPCFMKWVDIEWGGRNR